MQNKIVSKTVYRFKFTLKGKKNIFNKKIHLRNLFKWISNMQTIDILYLKSYMPAI